jgi:thiol-disulfide isomerase/thioredoxin
VKTIRPSIALALAASLALYLLLNTVLAQDPFGLTQQEPGMRAPDLSSPEWLNTDRPLRSFEKDLKGQVVLLDFWTYCCINCIHVLPDLAKLEQEFADDAFQVIGVHSNKFPQESEAHNIRQAILRYDIQHPVVVDQEHKIWQSYAVRAWPTLVLVAPTGLIIGKVSGEGNYETLRTMIKATLKEHKEQGTLADGPLKLKREVAETGILSYPGKVLAHGDKLYVADSSHHRVLEVSQKSGAVLRKFIASSPAFRGPQGMAMHGKWLYVADTENHLLRRVNLEDGKVETVAGNGKQARPLPRAGAGLESELNSPWALETVGDSIHIAMAGSHQLWTYHTRSGKISPLAGNGYENILDGPAPRARLAQPSGLALIGSKLFLADSEVSAIRYLDLDSDQVHTVVGSHLFRFGDQDGVGIEQVLLQHPLGVAAWNEQLLVADTYNNKIKLLDPASGKTSGFLGSGEHELIQGKLTLWEPGGLDVQGDTLYIADTNHHRILTVNLKSKAWQVVLGG